MDTVKKSVHLEHIQPLNISPYSYSARYMFTIIHTIVLVIHVLSWIVALSAIPNDVLVSPLAQITRQRTEIVGPCSYLGKGTAHGCLVSPYNASIGDNIQPSCTAALILDSMSCGVDERHEDMKFSLEAPNGKVQRFDDINIFYLLSLVDLSSIIFSVYALIMVWVSNYRSPPEYINSIVRWFMNIASRGRISKKIPPGELPQPTEIQEMNPRYPRAPEYNRRWLDIAVTYSILTVATSISVGITNFYVLLNMVVGIQCFALFGFIIDDARYQLRITDSDAYNKNYIIQQFYGAIKSEQTTFDVAYTDKQADIGTVDNPRHNDIWLNRLERAKPQITGWTQPVRNILFAFGAMLLIWYSITFTISDASQNIILHMPGEDRLGNDAMELIAVYYWIGTALIVVHMAFILIGDLFSGDRSVSESPTPGNFLFNQFDGDALFTIVLCFTKIIVSWLVFTTAMDVYNESGGIETRNGEKSASYLFNGDSPIDTYALRTILLIGGTAGFVFFVALIFFLTPSSRGYKIIYLTDANGNIVKDANGKPIGKCCTCTVGLKIKRLLCKSCLRPDEVEEEEEKEAPEAKKSNDNDDEDQPEFRHKNIKLYF